MNDKNSQLTYQIRQLDLHCDGDFHCFVQMEVSFFNEYRKSQNKPAFDDADIAEYRKNMRSLVDSAGDNLIALGAFSDSACIGLAICQICVSTWKASRILNIHDLFVTFEFRSRGVGRALIEASIDFGRCLGLPTVTIETSIGNSIARKLYCSHGFKGSGIEDSADLFDPIYIGKLSDIKIQMHLSLREKD